MLTSFFTSGVQHSLSMLSSKAIELRGLIERSLFRNPIPVVCSASFKECNKHVLYINITFHITLFHLDRLTKIELDFAWNISNYYCYAFIQSFFPMDWSIQKELSVCISFHNFKPSIWGYMQNEKNDAQQLSPRPKELPCLTKV